MSTPGEARRLDRQQRLLDLARDAQLVVQPLFLALHVEQVLDARAHAVERRRPGRRAGRAIRCGSGGRSRPAGRARCRRTARAPPTVIDRAEHARRRRAPTPWMTSNRTPSTPRIAKQERRPRSGRSSGADDDAAVQTARPARRGSTVTRPVRPVAQFAQSMNVDAFAGRARACGRGCAPAGRTVRARRRPHRSSMLAHPCAGAVLEPRDEVGVDGQIRDDHALPSGVGTTARMTRCGPRRAWPLIRDRTPREAAASLDRARRMPRRRRRCDARTGASRSDRRAWPLIGRAVIERRDDRERERRILRSRGSSYFRVDARPARCAGLRPISIGRRLGDLLDVVLTDRESPRRKTYAATLM